MLLKVLFYCFSIVLIYAALRVITARNPVTAVLHLLLCFISTSALWMLIQAEFLALSLVVIYVGAVLVLFLFVVMMLDIPHDLMKQGVVKYRALGIGVAVVMVIEMALVLASRQSLLVSKYPDAAAVLPDELAKDYSNTAELGMHIYTHHLYAFEIASVILLVAMIAAISLTKRKRPDATKFTPQRIQFKAQPATSLRIVSMPFSKLEEIESDSQKEDA